MKARISRQGFIERIITRSASRRLKNANRLERLARKPKTGGLTGIIRMILKRSKTS